MAGGMEKAYRVLCNSCCMRTCAVIVEKNSFLIDKHREHFDQTFLPTLYLLKSSAENKSKAGQNTSIESGSSSKIEHLSTTKGRFSKT